MPQGVTSCKRCSLVEATSIFHRRVPWSYPLRYCGIPMFLPDDHRTCTVAGEGTDPWCFHSPPQGERPWGVCCGHDVFIVIVVFRHSEEKWQPPRQEAVCVFSSPPCSVDLFDLLFLNVWPLSNAQEGPTEWTDCVLYSTRYSLRKRSLAWRF